MTDTNTKTIDGWLIVDWRDGSHRTRQNKPKQSELGSNEVMAEVEFEVQIPDIDVPTLSATIEVPEPRVYAATLEAIDDEDLPDWTKTANDVIEGDQVRIEQDATSSFDDIVDALVGRTLMRSPGRPDPEVVREYIADQVRNLRQD